MEEEFGIFLHSGFGESVYINMDQVIERSMVKCQTIAAVLNAG